LVSELNNIVYLFPGVVKSITKNGPIETKIFTGKFDGTGETVSKVTSYVYYTNDETILYHDFVSKIDNEEIQPIYDSIAFNTYKKDVTNDSGVEGGDIQMFLYGKKEEKTGFVRVLPKKADVGKHGFLFIFAVEE